MRRIQTFLWHAFINDKKKFSQAMLKLLIDNPVLLFQTIAFIVVPSIPSFLLIFVGVLCGHLLINVRLMLKLAKDTYLTTLDVNKGLFGKTYSLRNVFELMLEDYDDVYNDIETNLVQFRGIRSNTMESMVRVLVAEGSCNFVCYTNTQFFRSTVVISNIPKRTEGIQKFFVIHEVMHVLARMITQSIDDVVGILPISFYLIWVTFSIKLTAGSIVALLSLLVCTLIRREERKKRIGDTRMLDEVMADCMALGFLSQEDIKQIKRNKLVYKLLKDKTLSPTANFIRLSKLKENIELAASKKWVEAVDETISTFRPLPSLYELSLYSIAIALPAFWAIPTSWAKALAAITVFAILLIVFIFSFLLYSVFDGLLEKKIDILFPSAET